jgi:AcrR family transcriptional regulator
VPRNRQQLPHALRRAELLAAAGRVLLTKGYVDTTTAAIAREAGLAPNAVRWYFPHKDDALAAVVNEVVDMYLNQNQNGELDTVVQVVCGLASYSSLAAAVADRAQHSPAVDACANRVHELIARLVDGLREAPRNELARDAVIAVLENEITNPLTTCEPDVLRFILRQLLQSGADTGCRPSVS